MKINDRLDCIPYLEDQYSIFSEKIRNLQAVLSRSLGVGKKRVLILSFWAGEGKSLISLNLSVAIARSGNTVTLIDGDFRRPAMSHFFELNSTPGLADFLLKSETVVPQECVRALSDMDTLGVCGVGCYEDEDIDALVRPKALEEQLDRLESDWTIIDGPPLSVCADGLMLSEICDGVILVTNERTFQGEGEKRLLDQLKLHGAPVVGLVLNEVSSFNKDPKYRYNAYQNRKVKGYRYHSRSEEDKVHDAEENSSWWNKLVEVFKD